MKNIIKIIIALLPAYLFATSLSHEEITSMVTKIREERPGISLTLLENTPNPFAIVKQVAPEPKEEEAIEIEEVVEEEVVVEVYTLTAILNHAAFIDKKWYKVGDKIGSYTVIAVGKKSVTLKSGSETQQLVIPQKKKKFKMFKGN